MNLDGLIIGEIRYFGGTYVPEGFLECDGAIYTIQDHAPLYSVIGAQFGGDGQVSFAVPKIEGPQGFKVIIANLGQYPPRS